MTEKIIIVLLVLALIYLYYQNKKLKGLSSSPTMSSMFDYSDSDDERSPSAFAKDDEVPFPSRQKLQFELGQAREEIGGLQKEITRLKEGKDESEEVEELTTERDEAIREKQTAEQEVLSLSNKLKLKNQEVSRKDEEIARVKKEKGEKEVSLNKTITELKTKYSKQGKLLDEEQLECKKLEEKVEGLEQQIQELTNRSLSPIPGSFPEQDKVELESKHQDQLRAINLLFDEQAKDYESIDFNGLYGILEQVKTEKMTLEREREREREREQIERQSAEQRNKSDIQQTEKEKEVMKETIKDLETKQTQFNQELAQNIDS
jgi:chromosome segregation ATPase